MNKLTRNSLVVVTFTLAIATLLAVPALGAPSRSVAEKPATLDIAVNPTAAAPGDAVEVTVKIVPAHGVKINRYPKIKLNVPETAGVVAGGEAAVGNDSPPPPDNIDTNYFKEVDPVKLTLAVDAAAPTGRHELDGELTYYFCVTESGFCAPKKERVKILFDVR